MSSYIDLVSGDSYIQVNRKLVKLVGLEAAAYWAEILDIATKVVKKKTTDAAGYWKIDRTYVEERTGLSLEAQLDCDAILHSLGILEVNPVDPCKLGILVENYVKIITDENIKQLDLAKKKAKVSPTEKAKNKTEGTILTMKRLISEVDPDVRASYENWVESVYSAKRFLTKVKIQMFESKINGYTSDKSTKLAILDQAILTGYDNADWVINNYEKAATSRTPAATRIVKEQKISTGVSGEWEF